MRSTIAEQILKEHLVEGRLEEDAEISLTIGYDSSIKSKIRMMDMRIIKMTATCVIALLSIGQAQGINLSAKATLTAVEMDHGDMLQFRLQSGRIFHLVLEDTEAAIIEKVEPGGIIYTFSARVRVDGQSMTLRRYVCSQECFYEPYVINGVRIWLDTVKAVFDLIPIRYPRKGNLRCLPRKSARLALQDMTKRICPDETAPWIDDGRERLKVGDCYNGDDCYLGPYLGQACHVGLDVNHEKGSVLSAPIHFDTHAYFNSLEAGDNNNRWRGIRRWPNGDIWALQSHHLIQLLVPPNRPLKKGARYATTAGVHVGSHEHTHFEFKIGRSQQKGGPDESTSDSSSIAVTIDFDDQSIRTQENPEVIHLDPWILFWQIFEDGRRRDGKICAAMKPVEPGKTDQRLKFSAEGSRPGAGRDGLNYYWTFGDGGWERGAKVSHVFSRAGVYPVTVLVDDGKDRAHFTQHITISGEPIHLPVLSLTANDELSFRKRPVSAVDTYGEPPRWIPHTLLLTARASNPRPRPRILSLSNIGGGVLPTAGSVEVRYEQGQSWLNVTLKGQGNHQQLKVEVDANSMSPGKYGVMVSVGCRTAINSPQAFRVELQVPETAPQSEVTIDDGDSGFYATPYFWVGHRFCRCPVERRGYHGFYLTNGGRAVGGQFIRFTPDLQAGRYTVSFPEETPFSPETAFKVRVRHRHGEQTLHIQPAKSRTIGTFDFEEGIDGFVEIHAGDSSGLVIADALRFHRGS